MVLDQSLLSVKLRQATRVVHGRVERALPLMDSSLTLDGYREVVEAFFGFYVPLEPALVRLYPIHGEAPSAAGRDKVSSLRRDLRALGLTDDAVEALPLCPRSPEITTPGQALGGRYVFEGATLGGRFIVAALRDHLGIDIGTGAAFFDGYGAATGSMWRSFVAQLDASREPPGEVLGAATATFEAFEGWLRERIAGRP